MHWRRRVLAVAVSRGHHRRLRAAPYCLLVLSAAASRHGRRNAQAAGTVSSPAAADAGRDSGSSTRPSDGGATMPLRRPTQTDYSVPSTFCACEKRWTKNAVHRFCAYKTGLRSGAASLAGSTDESVEPRTCRFGNGWPDGRDEPDPSSISHP